MPGRSSYPASSDLSAFLSSGGFTVSTALSNQLPLALAAAIADFEKLTERRPFLGDSTESTRYFDPPTNGPLLFIDDLCAAPSAVTYQPAGASAQTLTLRTDYWLEPVNALAKGEPLTQLRFRRRWLQPLCENDRQSIAVTGAWGYAQSVPDNVWWALLGRAGWHVFAHLRQGTTGGKLSEKEGDVAVEYGIENWNQLLYPWVGKPELDGMGGAFGRMVQQYRKLSL